MIPLKEPVNEEEDKLLSEVSAAKSGVIGNGPVFSPFDPLSDVNHAKPVRIGGHLAAFL